MDILEALKDNLSAPDLAIAALHDICVGAGIRQSIRDNDAEYTSTYNSVNAGDFKFNAKKIIEFLVNSNFNYSSIKETETTVKNVADRYSFGWPLREIKHYSKVSFYYLCYAIVYFAKQAGFTFDDSGLSLDERTLIADDTILGGFIYLEELTPNSSNVQTKNAICLKHINANGKVYKSLYKNEGNKHPEIRACISTSFEKLNSTAYRLIGDRYDPSQNTKPSVYIRALTSSGNKYSVGGKNKVLVGSAKGWDYFELYFETLTDAQEFLTKVELAGIIPDKVRNLAPYGKRADIKNHNMGFVKVDTEFGEAYIIVKKANNEELVTNTEEEALVEAANDTAELDAKFNGLCKLAEENKLADFETYLNRGN